MAKVETNFVEVLLRKEFIGQTIYLDDEVTAITIQDLNYEPKIRTVYIFDGTNTHKLNIDKIFILEEAGAGRTKRTGNKRITGKGKRNWNN